MSITNTLFDRRLYQMRRDRIAADYEADGAFLVYEAADRLADRLDDINRDFPLALDLGCHGGQLQSALKGRGNIHRLIQCDISANMLAHATGERVQADEEWLPFAENTFDLVMSVGSLHHVNDLVGTLIQIHKILKPDGLFLAAVPGANSLHELRSSFAKTESELTGGITPRVSPFVEVRDAGGLLQRAGFALPVVDSDTITITYEHPLKLAGDLRAMGETNVLLERHKTGLNKRMMMQLCAEYAQKFSNNEGKVEATAELLTLTGWKPHASQQQPAKRGSGKMNLSDALN